MQSRSYKVSQSSLQKMRDSSKIEITREKIRTGDCSRSPLVSHLFLLVWGVFATKVTNFCVCRKRNPDKTKHLIDVLVTQHAKWIASRLRRVLFGQSTSSAVASTNQRPTQLKKPARKATPAIFTTRTHKNCGHMRRLRAAFSNSEEATEVGLN